MKTIKWAQMSPIERAWKKLQDADGGRSNDYFATRDLRKHWSAVEHRKRNKYQQLLSHWCKLKKLEEGRGL